MKKGFLILCPLIMFGLMPVKAQKVWSLEECINYALENNLQIKRQELNVRYNKNNHTQSYYNTLPNLNAQISQGYSSGQTFDYFESQYKDQNYWSGSLGIGTNMTLFGGFQIVNNIMKTRFDYLKSQSDLEKSKNDISLTLALAYLDILFARELLDAAQNTLEVTSLQVERTSKLLEVGNVAQGEYLQIKAQESNDKTNVLNASNNLEIAYLNLTQLLDLDSTGGFEVVIPANIDVEILTPLESVQEIFASAVKLMPEIKSAEYALKSSEKMLLIAWGQASPTVSLGGNLGTFHSEVAINPADPDAEYATRQQLKDYYNKQLNLTLTIPLFNRMQVKNNISNSQLQVRDFKLQLDQAKMLLYKEIQQAHADALGAKEKYSASVEAVNYNQEAFKYTSQKMEVGLVNSVDFNVAQNNLIKATSDMLQAKYEYIFRRKILDLYMGKQITL